MADVRSEVKSEKCDFYFETFKCIFNIDIDNQGYCLKCFRNGLLVFASDHPKRDQPPQPDPPSGMDISHIL